MYTTDELVTAFRDAFGEDETTAPPSVVSQTQIVSFLNQAQRELCWEGDILLSCAVGGTVAGQPTYSLPPDYLRASAVFIDRPSEFAVAGCSSPAYPAASTTVNTVITNGFIKVLAPYAVTGVDTGTGLPFTDTVASVTDLDTIVLSNPRALNAATLTFTNPYGGWQKALDPISVNQRDPYRRQSQQQECYYIWGENVNSVWSQVIGLEDVPQQTSAGDLHVFYRQLPQVMAPGGGGIAPEVPFQWQDKLINGALARAYFRLCIRDTKWIPLYDRATAEWKGNLVSARRYVNPLMLDRPRQIQVPQSSSLDRYWGS